ncbi:MAG: VOC family protein [Dehalococcoidia bacterium]|nr:VOC family protein [Dehalococcoidia bacterium]
MIPIKRVDHISMAAPRWREQADRLERLLGFRFLYSFQETAAAGFDGCVSQVPGTEIEFEVIAPLAGGGFVQRFLDEEGPGLHHVTVEVSDVDEAAAALERLGIRPFGGVTDDGMWRLTYVHPRDSGGILWQLFAPYKFPPEADRRTDGGAVGLRRMDHVSMAVADLERQIDWQACVFGMQVEGRWRDDVLGYDGAVMTIPGSQLKFEIVSPARTDSFVQRFLETRRPGMHHLCCEVESVERAAEALRREGIEPFGGVIESDWKRHTFLHPRDSGGVLVQLFEEPR